MPDGPLLRALHAALTGSDATPDAELLRRFAAARDDAAFELLVRRHADLVWKVCRGVLRGDPHAAEDAFQATFLALARSAGSVGRGDSVAGWLYRVARHAALRARRRSARAADPLPDAVPATGPPPDDTAAAGELAAVLTEEVGRLAAGFREPVLLCFFEGYTHAEAAVRLGWPVGTVASRLARAKDRLRDRLTRRGVALPAAGLAAALSAAPSPAVPPGLIRSCVLLAAGRAVVSGPVLTLTDGVLSAMRTANRKLAAAAAAVLVGLAGGGTLLAVNRGDEPPPAAKAPDPPKAPPPPAAAGKKPADEPRVADPVQRALSRRSLAQVAEAMMAYQSEHGYLPTDILDPKTGKPLLSWRVAVLPYMEQKNLYKQFKLDEPWDSEHNKAASAAVLKVYSAGYPFAGVGGFSRTYVKRLTGPGTLHEPGNRVSIGGGMTVLDRPTLLVVEAGEAVPWAKPEDIPFDPKDPPTLKGPFANVVHAVTQMPGSGYSLRPDLTPQEVKMLALREGELTWPQFERCLIRSGPDGKEYRAAADELEFLYGQLSRLQAIQLKLMAEEFRRSGRARRADDAAEVGFKTLAAYEQVEGLVRQFRDNPALADSPELMQELTKILDELRKRREKK